MKICLLASGSKGNSTYFETQNHRILIDLGTTSLYAEKALREMEIDPASIDSIFITHTHIDHVAGLKVFCKKYNPTVYLTEKMYQEIKEVSMLTNVVLIDQSFVLDELSVTTFPTSHDTVEGVAYIINCEGKSIAYITDTGYISEKNYKLLENKDLYIIESNHDVELLMKSSKPFHLKQRILGDKGHLSNKDTSYHLSKLTGDNTRCIVLSHLSEENNTEELAIQTLQETFGNREMPNVIVAKQKSRTDLIEV